MDVLFCSRSISWPPVCFAFKFLSSTLLKLNFRCLDVFIGMSSDYARPHLLSSPPGRGNSFRLFLVLQMSARPSQTYKLSKERRTILPLPGARAVVIRSLSAGEQNQLQKSAKPARLPSRKLRNNFEQGATQFLDNRKSCVPQGRLKTLETALWLFPRFRPVDAEGHRVQCSNQQQKNF